MNDERPIGDKRFVQLWTDYLEGELNDAGLAELRALMSADERLLKTATDLYQTHRLLGIVVGDTTATSDDFVRSTLARLPVDSEQFATAVMRQLDATTAKRSRSQSSRWLTLSAALAVLAAASLAIWTMRVNDPAKPLAGVHSQPGSVQPEVRLSGSFHARFFGELAPQLDALLEPGREYVMTEGLVELAFSCGASVIVESPAVFRVLSDTCLALDTGRCSVHAPEGAEGFRVETPATRIVDRGTRFTVSVAETNETEVQVVEGAADVYQRALASTAAAGADGTTPAEDAARELASEVRLTEREARRFTTFGGEAVSPVRFRPGDYRGGLPDRVIGYEATIAGSGGAEKLVSVTVQRGGRTATYPLEQLIPAELTWFQSANAVDRSGHIVAGDQMPSSPKTLLSDGKLNSGVINPGGSIRPLTSDPVMNIPEDPQRPNTPGFAVRFRTPIVNGPGPDVVFFELQTFSNPLNGDAFHVSPLEFGPGRKSLTVGTYDLTMNSPEALRLARFSLYRYSQSISSLDELLTASSVRAAPGTRFHALAVGIDLSNLGFAEGEQVEGLFFQDANDDEHRVDPVFIGGLPTPL